MTTLARAVQNLGRSGPVLREATASGNLRVLASLLGPAYRGMVMQEARGARSTAMQAEHRAIFDWSYLRDRPQLSRLYEAAKSSQWNATTDLDWSTSVDPLDPEHPLIPEEFHPVSTTPAWHTLGPGERMKQLHDLLAWLLSQSLHGEQGALFAACQVTEAVPWLDAKLYGSSQVVDEGRHVEVFHGYLTRKLEKLYEINDNLYTIVDALMTDSRWDVKFLGMQIMIEGLALGAFGTFRQITGEPLLKQLLTSVITDEARHVHFGVLALQEWLQQLSDRERKEREDWAFEVSLLLRNRFLAWEFYEEHWAHAFDRAEWERLSVTSKLMGSFRQTMFKRIVPNLKRIGLLSDRIRPRYDALGLLGYERGRAAPELTATDLLEDR
ncbi:MAG TPA: ferritin-like domain-containing protein [Myxococcaceae bacterium]|nr:ferritin-like domain-containing protein [Myxococcaceae bacterium]